jgi:hypothetical protein
MEALAKFGVRIFLERMVLFGDLLAHLDFMVSSVRLVLGVHLSLNTQMSIVVHAKICHLKLKLKIQLNIMRVSKQCQCVNINVLKDTSKLKIILSA